MKVESHNVLYKAAGYINAWENDHGEYKNAKIQEEKNDDQTLPRTSVVLLLLVIVAEFPFTLCRHPTLCLHHLLYFIGTILETLGSVEALGVGIGMNAGTVELADGVVTLGHVASNATICVMIV